MAHVFLSYDREDRDAARQLAQSLEHEGWSVWWDPEIKPHQLYTDVIDAAIGKASAVLVLWSARARESAWVRSEANEGLEARKLVQARMDGARPPRPFDQFQVADLSDWRGGLSHAGRASLSESIRDLVGEAGVKGLGKPKKQRAEPASRMPRRGGLAGPILAAGVASLAGAGVTAWTTSPDFRDFIRYGGAVQVNVSVSVNRENVARVDGDVAAMMAENPDIF